MTGPYAFRSYSRPTQKDNTNVSLSDVCIATTDSLTDIPVSDASYSEIRDLCAVSREPIRALLSIGYAGRPSRGPFREPGDSQDRPPTLDNNTGDSMPELTEDERLIHERWLCPASNEDNSDPNEELSRLRLQAETYCKNESIRRSLKEWAERLVRLRRRRAHTTRWETYVGFRRICLFCPRGEVVLDSVQLDEHIESHHKISAVRMQGASVYKKG